MDCAHPYPLRAAVAAIVAGCAFFTTAAGQVEHVRTETKSAVPAAGPSASADVEAALARIKALTSSGDAFLKANQYASAEAAYSEAVQLAEQDGGRESELVLAPLLGLSNTLARSGHYEEAIPRLQRALAIERAQYGLFDVRQQGTLKTLADSLTALDRKPEAQDLMIYRARVAEKAYGEADVKVVPALCDLGDWFAETGKSPEADMTFKTALNIVVSKRSSNDLLTVEPLRGIARTYMRRQSYPDAWLYPPRRHPAAALRVRSVSPSIAWTVKASASSGPRSSIRKASTRCNGHCGSSRLIWAHRRRRGSKR